MTSGGYTPSANFHGAADFASTSPSLSKLPTDKKLELYALFKYLTVSPKPTPSRPSIFDMTGRAKWDAWSKASAQWEGRAPEDVEARYIEIVHGFGWAKAAESSLDKGKGKAEQLDELDELDESDESEESAERGSAGTGMSVSVSVVAREPESNDDELNTLHGLALSKDHEKLAWYLKHDPDVDLNAVDQYGFTPLHLACDRAILENVILLLDHGADPLIKDEDGDDALALARIAGHEDIARVLEARLAAGNNS